MKKFMVEIWLMVSIILSCSLESEVFMYEALIVGNLLLSGLAYLIISKREEKREEAEAQEWLSRGAFDGRHLACK